MSPTTIHLHEAERVLEITWDDGRVSRYSLTFLRGWCPCAVCQGHLGGVTNFIEKEDPMIVNIEPVGGYAMRPIWNDGHRTGIFSFDYLLSLEKGPPAPGPRNEDLLAEAALPTRH